MPDLRSPTSAGRGTMMGPSDDTREEKSMADLTVTREATLL